MTGLAGPAPCLASGRTNRTRARAPRKTTGARSMLIRSAALLVLLIPLQARAAVTCASVLQVLGSKLTDVNCFASPDLTTNNPLTTPVDNVLTPPLPVGAFTPQTDRGVISPAPPNRTPITKKVPGLQLDPRIAF